MRSAAGARAGGAAPAGGVANAPASRRLLWAYGGGSAWAGGMDARGSGGAGLRVYVCALVGAILVQCTNATHYVSASNNCPLDPH